MQVRSLSLGPNEVIRMEPDTLQISLRIQRVVLEITGKEVSVNVGPFSEYGKDLGFDSLDFVEVVMGIEDEFDISIADEEAEDLLQMSILEMAEYITDLEGR